MKLFTCCLLVMACLNACSPNDVKIDNRLKNFFDDNQVNGCFALFDNATGEFTVYNYALPR